MERQGGGSWYLPGEHKGPMWAFTSPRLEARPSSQNPEGPWPVPQPQAENASGPPACRPSGGWARPHCCHFPEDPGPGARVGGLGDGPGRGPGWGWWAPCKADPPGARPDGHQPSSPAASPPRDHGVGTERGQRSPGAGLPAQRAPRPGAVGGAGPRPCCWHCPSWSPAVLAKSGWPLRGTCR